MIQAPAEADHYGMIDRGIGRHDLVCHARRDGRRGEPLRMAG
jgi:hypothetical protein